MQFCSECGQGNADDAGFCVQCGTPLPSQQAGLAQAAGGTPPAPPVDGQAPPPPPEQATPEGQVPPVPVAGAAPPPPPPPVPGAPQGSVPPGPGVPPPGYQPGYARPLPTDGMAVASLIMGIVAFVFCPLLAAALAIIFGYIAKGNIRSSGGALGGDGMATMGIILGFVNLAITAIVIIIVIIAVLAGTHTNGWSMISPAVLPLLALA